jgi:hypothetical protein
MGIRNPTGVENRFLRNRRRFCCLCPNGTDDGGLSGERLLFQQTLDCFVVNDDLSFMRFFDLPFFEHRRNPGFLDNLEMGNRPGFPHRMDWLEKRCPLHRMRGHRPG